MTTKSSPPASRSKTKSPTREIGKQQSSAPIRLKTVVRRLPPNLPESVFWDSTQPWVSDETASWKIFYQGKLRKRLNKENIPSRAYILFKNEEYLAAFSRDYDGHMFRDKQGNESQAVVEFAPNQKVPPEKKKVDSRHATIHQDEDYLSFTAAIEDIPTKPIEVDYDALLASTIPPEEPKITPLLAALREQKLSAQEKKLAASEASKAHPRKGGGTAAPAAQKPETADLAPPPSGKRSKKGKGAQTTSPSTSAPAPTNPPSTKSGGGRSRSSQTSSVSNAPSSASTSVAPPTSGGKDAAASADGEQQQQSQPQKRGRPMVGLQSRHLKAALSGAGVQMAGGTTAAGSGAAMPILPSPSTATSPSLTSVSVASGTSSSVPAATAAGMGANAPSSSSASLAPTSAPPRGTRSGRSGGEKRGGNDAAKDGNAKDGGGRVGGRSGGGGGGGGGKDKARSRHPSGQGPAASRAPEPTPRILSRQDLPPSSLTIGDGVPKDKVPAPPASGSQDAGATGAGRSRAGRRGRGQG